MSLIVTVESDDLDALMMADELSGGDDVVRFSTLWDALAFMVESPPAVIVIDTNAPELAGVDVLGIIFDTIGQVPIVVCTHDGTEVAAQRSLEVGAIAHLSKYTLGSHVLANTVHSLIHQRVRIAA
jgi:CheY-like chemotaxis protein